MRKLSKISKTLALLLGTAWQVRRRVFFYEAIRVFTRVARPFVNAIFPKLVIDELTHGRDAGKIIIYAALTVVLDCLLNAVTDILHHIIEKHRDFLDRRFDEMRTNKIMEIDFEHTEDPKALDQIHKAQEGLAWYSGGPVGLINVVSNIVTAVFQFIGAAALFASGSPVLLLIIGVTVAILSFMNHKRNAIENRRFLKLSKINRVTGYYFFQITNLRFSKDIRLFGSSGMFLSKTSSLIDETVKADKITESDMLKCDKVSVSVQAVSDGFIYFTLGYGLLQKLLTLGDFTMFVSLTQTLKSAIEEIIRNIQEIHKRCAYAYEFVKFMEYPNAKIPGEKKLEIKPAFKIEFKNVSFKYPRAESYALKNISITINGGEKLSIVGLNGAGKTTFIKLLCRLYDVSDGEILLDGVNIKEYDYDSYVKALAVVFQDFSLFAFSAAENIGACKREEVNEKLLNEVINLSGLRETLEKLPEGENTFLDKQYEENGTEFSGGQRQKVAIARALYKNAPIVILDEPTAALDPMAEYEIYSSFNSLVGGKTAIYISHRLSSCKFCDKIAVFSENTIKEYGTHDELVKKENGLYAEMFAAQAQYYKN
ncbi:MAG: ABC transporter ATP-binding protein/permease [Clostridiales bacterium]|nr:ABC transporter ATP-binding protein/permease [Clostridiales bacterium]